MKFVPWTAVPIQGFHSLQLLAVTVLAGFAVVNGHQHTSEGGDGSHDPVAMPTTNVRGSAEDMLLVSSSHRQTQLFGTCGNGNVGDGFCFDGTCCSVFGWCGTTAEHCGGGGGLFPTFSPPVMAPVSFPFGTCGNGNRGDGVCSDGTCCSTFGWCGTTAEHCSGGGGGPSGPVPTFSSPVMAPVSFPFGTCGNGNRGDGFCADGTCCSSFGWCGTTAEHCGGGGGLFPTFSSPVMAPVSFPFGTCGNGNRGDGLCSDGTCCSTFGWCGTTAEHCGGAIERGISPPPPSSSGGTVSSPAIVLTLDQVQAGINAKGDSVAVSPQVVDVINEITMSNGYSLYRQIAFVAQTIWESGSYQFKEEIDTASHGSYQACDSANPNVLPTTGKQYYGRGYLQLSWCYNYKAYGASRMFNGDPDLFYNQPELVAEDEFFAMDSAAWFFETNVFDTSGQFGLTTKAINGALECSGQSSDIAKKRYEVFVALANAVGLSGYSESGCYN